MIEPVVHDRVNLKAPLAPRCRQLFGDAVPATDGAPHRQVWHDGQLDLV